MHTIKPVATTALALPAGPRGNTGARGTGSSDTIIVVAPR